MTLVKVITLVMSNYKTVKKGCKNNLIKRKIAEAFLIKEQEGFNILSRLW